MAKHRALVLSIMLGFVCLLPRSAIGGEGQAGNGGDIVVCGTCEIWQLLDFYSARRTLNLFPVYGFESKLTYDSSAPNFAELKDLLPIVEFWLNGLASVDPERASKYRNYLRAFPNEWRYLRDQALPDINDHDDILICEGCRIIQTVVQQTPATEFHGRYLVDAKAWSLLRDPMEKAGMILHEIVYRDALERGHTNSFYVRVLTALIADQHSLRSNTSETFFDKLLQTRMVGYYATEGAAQFAFFPEVTFDSPEEALDFCHLRWGVSASLVSNDNLHLPRKIIGEYLAKHATPIWFADDKETTEKKPKASPLCVRYE